MVCLGICIGTLQLCHLADLSAKAQTLRYMKDDDARTRKMERHSKGESSYSWEGADGIVSEFTAISFGLMFSVDKIGHS